MIGGEFRRCQAGHCAIAPLQGAEAALVGEGEVEGPRAAHRHRSSDNRSGRPDTMLVWRYIYAVLWLLVVVGDQQARFRAPKAWHLPSAVATRFGITYLWQLATWSGTTPGL